MPSTRSQSPSSLRAKPSQPLASRPVEMLPLLALGVLIGVVFLLQLRHFAPFITDDAFISLRYSERLLEGKGLTWNDMRPVEGYTNLLWVLLCAGLGVIGVPLPIAAQALGVLCTLAILVAVGAQAYRDYPAKIRFIAALLGCGALVLSGPIDVWATGGLEQPLLAALLAWAVYFGTRWISTSRPAPADTWTMGLLLGLACITRADAPLFSAAFFLGAVLADGIRLPSVVSRARLLPLPIAFFLGQLLFRRMYYHDWLPNTAYVKVAFTLHRLRTGLKYDLIGTETNLAFFVLAMIGAVAMWSAGKQRQVKFIGTIVFCWLFYLVVIGGDIFPSVRHFVPALALSAFLVSGCGLLTLAAPFRFSRPRVAAFCALLALVLVSDHFCAPETWESEGRSIGLFLKQAFGPAHPLLVSDAAGVVPYYSGLPALDPLGLNDYHIARSKTADRGQGWVGHELADGKYVLDHRPDLLLFSDFQSTIYFPSDQQIAHDPRFSYYQPVRFQTEPPDAVKTIFYVRRIDGPLGIRVTPQRVSVPAYLANMDQANVVRLVRGQAQLVIPPGGTVTFDRVPLGTGSWKVDPQGAYAASVSLTRPSGQKPTACSQCLELSAPGKTTFRLENTGNTPATLASIDLILQ